MKKTSENRISDARAGFTLLEIVVVIVVFGVLCAAAAVNWASFMRYQELREDAAAFHKELLALKAYAVSNNYIVLVEYNTNHNGYTVKMEKKDPVNDTDPLPPPRPPVDFNKNVTIGERRNTWMFGISIEPDNLNAFGQGKGSVEIVSESSKKKKFRILKDIDVIKPVLQYSNDGGSTWK